MHGRYGPEVSEPGRRAARDKWLTLADPEGKLRPAERERRARSLEKAHLTRCAFLSVRSRMKKKNATGVKSVAVEEENARESSTDDLPPAA